MHNFTFDTLDKASENATSHENVGLIRMAVAIHCKTASCNFPQPSLRELTYFSILTSTELVQADVYKLQNLAMPISRMVVCSLLFLALCIGLIFSAKYASTEASKLKFILMEKIVAERVQLFTGPLFSSLVKMMRKDRKAIIEINYNMNMYSSILQVFGSECRAFKRKII